MESMERKWPFRLLSALLAVFVAMYFITDSFGGIFAVGDGEEEIGFSNNEIMMFSTRSTTFKAPFTVTGVSVKIAGKTLEEGDSAKNVVKNGDPFDLEFAWSLNDGKNHKEETYTYDLTEDLKGIELDECSEKVSFSGDASFDATYTVKKIGGKTFLYVEIGNVENVYHYKGAFKITGKVSTADDPSDDKGNFQIHFADKTFNLIDSGKIPYLNMKKEASGEIYKGADGSYYQNFKVTVTNTTNVLAENITLQDTHGELFVNGSISNVTLNGSPASVSSSGSTGSITIGTIPGNSSATVGYTLRLDKNNMISGSGNWNNAVVKTEIQGEIHGYANAKLTPPSISKSGNLSDGKITWIITVDPGVFKDESFTVTDIPGSNLTSAEIAAALGIAANADGSVAIPANKITKNGNTYTVTYTTTAPEADEYSNTNVSNRSRLNIAGGTKDAQTTVTIPAKKFDGYITKTHGNVTTSGSSIVIPWTVTVTLPDTELSSVTLNDSIYRAYMYGDSPERIANIYNNLKINNIPAVRVNDNVWKVDGVGEITMYWASNVSFMLKITDQSFLSNNRGKDVTLSYSTQVFDSNIGSVRNIVEMNAELANGTSIPQQKAEDEYVRPITVSKVQDYGETNSYSRVARTWRVTVSNNGSAYIDGQTVTIKDTLPKGYQLLEDSLVISTGDRNSAFYKAGSVVNSGASVSVNASPVSSVSENTFTVTVTLDHNLAAALSNNGALNFYYSANMTDDRYVEFNSTLHTEDLSNKVEATSPDGEKAYAAHNFTISAPYNEILSKACTEQKRTTSGDKSGFAASYKIELNKPRVTIGNGKTITVTDKLGASLHYKEGSLKILEYHRYNDWNSSNVTSSVKYSFDSSSNTLTFELKDNTYYVITYDIYGNQDDMLSLNELTSSNATEEEKQMIKDELNHRYGNTVSVKSISGTENSSSVTLDSSTYRLSGTVSYMIQINGTKKWDDAGIGNRPGEIVVLLKQTKTNLKGESTNKTFTYHLINGSTAGKTDTDTEFYRQIKVNNNDEWTFSIKDVIVADNLGALYTYTLEEKTVDGYVPAYECRTSPDGEWQSLSKYIIGANRHSVDVEITNTYLGKRALTISKTDITGLKQLPGAQLVIERAEGNNADLSGTVVTGAVSAVRHEESITINTGRSAAHVGGLPEGKYILKETIAPDGYKKVTTEFSFSVDANGAVTATNSGNFSYESSENKITLKDDSFCIPISKVDVDNETKQLPGARLSITPLSSASNIDLSDVYVVNGTEAAGSGKKAFVFTTGKETALVYALPAGRYVLKEVAAPDGYELVTTEFRFTVNKDGTVAASTGGSFSYKNGTIILKDKKTSSITSSTTGTSPTIVTVPTWVGTSSATTTTTITSETDKDEIVENTTTTATSAGTTTAPEEDAGAEKVTVSDKTTVPAVTTIPDKTTAPTVTTVPDKTTEPGKTTEPDKTTVPEETTKRPSADDSSSGQETGNSNSDVSSETEENPGTGVSFTALAAVFAAAGSLAVVTRKRKKNN